jgi:hypothetical protein
MICEFCSGEWCANEGGVIKLLEQMPEGYRDEDTCFDFCSFKCLKRWLS